MLLPFAKVETYMGALKNTCLKCRKKGSRYYFNSYVSKNIRKKGK